MQKLNWLISRGTKLASNLGQSLIKAKFLEGEVRSEIPNFQNFGFASNAPEGSKVLCLFIAGSRENGVVVATDLESAKPKNLEEGEVALFNNFGCQVLINKDNEVIISGAAKVFINSDAEIGGKSFKELESELNTLRQRFDAHTHSTSSPGSPTGPPI